MFEVGLYHYLVLATLLFGIGLYGVLSSRNAIRLLMCIELMLNAVNINLVAFNNYINLSNLSGQVFSVFILTVSAAEAAVGLAVLIALYRCRATVDMERFNLLKW
jgi:NAD(P)H-quinone oxidoreductase subunit 4L